ncbi:hypothetical protein [Streptosporangium sp. NPDC051022]|uniref:hypothetical protein n=1 Tax=Streptosporangium sp. NPDC051022 TaxID=3155752 RepID=UPI003438D117
MNHPDVPRSQGRHAGRHAVAEPGPAQAVSPAVLEQTSLEQMIGRFGPLTPQRVAAVGLAVLDQLVAVHNRGMLHGDVRPGSVLLGPHDQITLAAPTLRSPAFTAPEGVTGPAADLWSLGATLYTAVEGRPPSPGGSLDNAGPIGPILFGMLSGDPGRRPAPGTLRSVLLDLARNGAHTPLPPVRADAVPPPSPWASSPFPEEFASPSPEIPVIPAASPVPAFPEVQPSSPPTATPLTSPAAFPRPFVPEAVGSGASSAQPETTVRLARPSGPGATVLSAPPAFPETAARLPETAHLPESARLPEAARLPETTRLPETAVRAPETGTRTFPESAAAGPPGAAASRFPDPAGRAFPEPAVSSVSSASFPPSSPPPPSPSAAPNPRDTVVQAFPETAFPDASVPLPPPFGAASPTPAPPTSEPGPPAPASPFSHPEAGASFPPGFDPGVAAPPAPPQGAAVPAPPFGPGPGPVTPPPHDPREQPFQAQPAPVPAPVPVSQELVPVSGNRNRGPSAPSGSEETSGETGPTVPSADRRAGVFVPRSVVGLTGGLLLAMAVTIGVLVAPMIGGSADAEDAQGAGSSTSGARFASAPRACSLLDDKQVEQVVPGFRSSEVEFAACDWLNQLDWRKPSTEKFDLSVRLVAQKQDASGITRAKQYISGKRNDFVNSGKYATPKPAPPQDLKGIGDEAFSTGKYSTFDVYGGSYRVTVVVRVSNLIAEIEYRRGGVKDDADGKIAQGAAQVARWLTASLKSNG